MRLLPTQQVEKALRTVLKVCGGTLSPISKREASFTHTIEQQTGPSHSLHPTKVGVDAKRWRRRRFMVTNVRSDMRDIHSKASREN